LAIVNQCLDSGRTLIDIELHIIQPALYRIGEKWQANQVTVAQEHLATAIVQSVMTVGLLRSPPPIAIGKRALLACVEGNNHAVGLRMVSDAFQLAGWDVQYLGANVPTSALIGQVASWEPHLVGLSISFPQHLQVAKSVIDQLKLRFGNARPSVLIGGLAIKRFNRLADLIGTDAHGLDAREAVVCGNRLTTAQSSL
jgi:methanogenic corrinoid protein MtbC1